MNSCHDGTLYTARPRGAHPRPSIPAPPPDAAPRRARAPDGGRLARFAPTAQALGVSLPAARALRAALLGDAAPSAAGLGRRAQEAGRRAGAVLAVPDQYGRPRARQVAADEVCAGRRPALMTAGQDSPCRPGARLAPGRGGPPWAQEFGRLPAAGQVTRGGGPGLREGLEPANAARARAGRPALAGQEGPSHTLHRGRRALCQVRHKAVRAPHEAGSAEEALRAARRRGRIGGGRASAANRWWEPAGAAWGRWAAQGRAFGRLRAALRPRAPAGEPNTRARAAGGVRAALAGLTGPEWSRLRSKLVGPRAFAFLGRAHERLAAPVAPAPREAAVQAEALRQGPEAPRGEGAPAAALRGVARAAGLGSSPRNL